MKNKPGDSVRIQHILDAINEIELYTEGITFDGFMKNSMMRFACIKQLEIIGEAAKRVTEELKHKYPHINWREIVGLRNILIHEYFGIDERIVWEIIQNDIPKLKSNLKPLIIEI